MILQEQRIREWESAAIRNANRYIASGYHHNEQEYNASGLMSAGELMNIVCPIFREDVANKTLLEIGCGNGRITNYLADVFKGIVAIDCSGTMIDKANERVKKDNVIFKVNNGEYIPEDNNKFDVVYTFIVFQHCNKDTILKYFSEAHRILKPGGYFIFQLPVSNEHSEPQEFNDVAKWTKEELEEGLKMFSDVKTKDNHFDLHICQK